METKNQLAIMNTSTEYTAINPPAFPEFTKPFQLTETDGIHIPLSRLNSDGKPDWDKGFGIAVDFPAKTATVSNWNKDDLNLKIVPFNHIDMANRINKTFNYHA